MKTTGKILVCLLFLGTAGSVIAQQATSTAQPTTKKKVKKHTSKKSTKDVDNKIAVSDQMQPTEKGQKKQAVKKDKGITNK